MIHFDLPKEKSSIIKVIGVGGGGSNAVNYMYGQQIDGVNFIICNTDAQAIALSGVPNKVQLGPHLTQGLGAGANPEIGRQATEESLEEIRRILEVNTKMAFITAGMGGGTGTGGAPIIAKICKDLGILTVGIVTTPFAYEGKKRLVQAEEGIKTLKQYVDTLLVISNDKLRHQFGNLKMREAFAKADNVLATAAKCITDVINSTGQINVDFADVCTVMKNGGVAILGSAAVAGENRAQRAIEEAMNSPLLNDNDIRGAKWILININSAEGDHEFTMDEVEIIQNHLLTQAGEHTDVILGMGYDHTLDDQIGITLIATGFEHKDPFARQAAPKPEKTKEEKIVMVLGEDNTRPEQEKEKEPVTNKEEDPLSPRLVTDCADEDAPMPSVQDEVNHSDSESREVIHWELDFRYMNDRKTTQTGSGKNTVDDRTSTVGKIFVQQPAEKVISTRQSAPATAQHKSSEKNSTNPSSAAAGGYLARPSNIYAESKPEEITSKSSAEEPIPQQPPKHETGDDPDMRLVFREDVPAADEPLADQTPPPDATPAEEPAMQDETEALKRKAAERLQKLRNLSFNANAADLNSEFENVPAYIRRNMELYGPSSVAENFYSNYEVKTDENNNTHISTINTFLDGKKPD